MTKTCTKCQTAKDVTSFYHDKRVASGLESWCKSCRSAYSRAYYAARMKRDPEYGMRHARKRYGKRHGKALAIRTQRGCADCGENHPACLDFHHIDPSTKVAGVMSLVHDNVNWQVVEAEMAKCVVLCANCHRKRHYNEKAEASAKSA